MSNAVGVVKRTWSKFAGNPNWHATYKSPTAPVSRTGYRWSSGLGLCRSNSRFRNTLSNHKEYGQR